MSVYPPRTPGERGRSHAETVVDIALAALLVLLAVFGTGPATDNQDLGPAPIAAYVLAILAAAAVAGCTRAPLGTFVVVGVLTAVYIAAGYAFGPILISFVVVAYVAASRRQIRPVLTCSCALAVLTALATVIRVVVRDAGEWVDYPRLVGWIAVPIAVGIAVRVWRRSRVEVRAEQVRRAASEERLRMAQDLHDVVGHGLAAIAMQAGVALHVLERDPAKVRESLEAIQATSRDALDELRSELAALTSEERTDSAAARRPAAGLTDLDVLVDRVQAGGVRVETEVARLDDLSAPVDTAAFRIIQEALTNVLRHADAQMARVTIDVTEEMLTVTVDDTGAGNASTAPRDSDEAVTGRGIEGMRDRATAVGGTLMTGPGPEGGFRVRAVLPIHSNQRQKASVS